MREELQEQSSSAGAGLQHSDHATTARAALRWQALVLFGVLVGKVFLYDLSLLDRAYRIVSFFVLGTALLVVSFFYQRRQAAEKEEKKP